jgi:hypothetical protein
MDFRTELSIPVSPWPISHSHRIFTIGSCFADCMGTRFEQLQFNTLANPFGTLYNPISIFQNLKNCLENTNIDDNQLVVSRNHFFHYQFHSEHFDASKEGLLEKLTTLSSHTGQFLKETDYLFITLGTAFVYALRSDNNTVANCHKMPPSFFTKRMLSVQEIVDAFHLFAASIQTFCPRLKIVFTISPVRHLKDTLALNSVSKATLRLACHQLENEFPEMVGYFPAYELVMDDLRDYRFYKEDLIHPNDQAEKYIWEKFSETHFEESAIKTNQEITDIISALEHRPFQPQSGEHQRFVKKLLENTEKLNAQVPIPRLLQQVALKLNTTLSN